VEASRDAKPPFDLVASYWTIAGNARLRMFGGTDYSPLDLRERIAAAGAAGYTGIGFHSRDLEHWSGRYPAADIAGLLADNGIRYVELEILREWFVAGERRAESDATRAELLALAEQLPIGHVKVGSSFGPDRFSVEHMAEEFARLCSQFAEVGTRVAIEPIPNAHLRTPDEVVAVVEAAGAGNGGLILDTWQTFRAGVDYASLQSIPGARIFSIEIADGAAEPVVDLANDGCNHRMLPGTGAFRVTDFVAAVLATGYAGQIGVEILSEENRLRSLTDEARLSHEAALRVLAPLAGQLAANRAGAR
jgi:sugar phosphate isomerase/epimerase